MIKFCGPTYDLGLRIDELANNLLVVGVSFFLQLSNSEGKISELLRIEDIVRI